MKHIIIIGFKSVGKSLIGKKLARKLRRVFIDLDDEIIRYYQKIAGNPSSCREIMEKHGENYFRKIEHEALVNVITVKKPFILAVGGGTPMRKSNRAILKKHILIHVTAPKDIVFKRIISNGKPAFFPENLESSYTFKRLWQKREPVYSKMADITINNSGRISEAAQAAFDRLSGFA